MGEPWAVQRHNRIALHATCQVHKGPLDFANLVVRKLENGRIEFDPHVAGMCAFTVGEDAARKLAEALLRWVG